MLAKAGEGSVPHIGFTPGLHHYWPRSTPHPPRARRAFALPHPDNLCSSTREPSKGFAGSVIIGRGGATLEVAPPPTLMGRSSNLRTFALPRPDALSPLSASPAILAHNTRRYGRPLVGVSWPYRGGAMPNFAFWAFSEVELRFNGVLGNSQRML
jgi:hypothetical protein